MTRFQKILVIDDEVQIRNFLRVSLSAENYSITESENAKDGIRDVIATRPELVILDLGLPDLSGEEVIKKIRDWSQVPIIVLTAKEDEQTKVRILDAGADDYLTKPFSVPELLARVRVIERHAAPQNHDPIFQSGPLSVDLSSRKITVDNTDIHLTATEYDILKLLIKHAGKVVTHRQILKEIWGPNAVEHTQYLRVYVGHLRKKIESNKNNTKLIINEPGVGYRLLTL